MMPFAMADNTDSLEAGIQKDCLTTFNVPDLHIIMF